MLSNRTRHPSQSERALYLLYFIKIFTLHFILFHIFHILTENQRKCRAKENQVQVPLPSKGHVLLQWFELADELYYLRVVLLIHKSSKHI